MSETVNKAEGRKRRTTTARSLAWWAAGLAIVAALGTPGAVAWNAQGPVCVQAPPGLGDAFDPDTLPSLAVGDGALNQVVVGGYNVGSYDPTLAVGDACVGGGGGGSGGGSPVEIAPAEDANGSVFCTAATSTETSTCVGTNTAMGGDPGCWADWTGQQWEVNMDLTPEDDTNTGKATGSWTCAGTPIVSCSADLEKGEVACQKGPGGSKKGSGDCGIQIDVPGNFSARLRCADPVNPLITVEKVYEVVGETATLVSRIVGQAE